MIKLLSYLEVRLFSGDTLNLDLNFVIKFLTFSGDFYTPEGDRTLYLKIIYIIWQYFYNGG